MSQINESEKVVAARAKAQAAAADFYLVSAELDAMIDAMKAVRNTRVNAASLIRFAAIDELVAALEEASLAAKNGGAS